MEKSYENDEAKIWKIGPWNCRELNGKEEEVIEECEKEIKSTALFRDLRYILKGKIEHVK